MNKNLFGCACNYVFTYKGDFLNSEHSAVLDVMWKKLCEMIESKKFSIADIAAAVYVLTTKPEVEYSEILKALEKAARKDKENEQ